MLIAIIPILVFLIGLLVYALATNGKTVEIGRIAMFCGLLVTVFVFAGRTVHLP